MAEQKKLEQHRREFLKEIQVEKNQWEGGEIGASPLLQSAPQALLGSAATQQSLLDFGQHTGVANTPGISDNPRR
jgi:hypothetical protein